jgi:hypothetical protein
MTASDSKIYERRREYHTSDARRTDGLKNYRTVAGVRGCFSAGCPADPSPAVVSSPPTKPPMSLRIPLNQAVQILSPRYLLSAMIGEHRRTGDDPRPFRVTQLQLRWSKDRNPLLPGVVGRHARIRVKAALEGVPSTTPPIHPEQPRALAWARRPLDREAGTLLIDLGSKSD